MSPYDRVPRAERHFLHFIGCPSSGSARRMSRRSGCALRRFVGRVLRRTVRLDVHFAGCFRIFGFAIGSSSVSSSAASPAASAPSSAPSSTGASFMPASAAISASRSCSRFWRRASAATASASSARSSACSTITFAFFFAQAAHRHQRIRLDDREVVVAQEAFFHEPFGQFDFHARERAEAARRRARSPGPAPPGS